MIKNTLGFSITLCVLATAALGLSASRAGAQESDQPAKTYSYTSQGIAEIQRDKGVGMERWKLLLDESNLGGKELELIELTLPAGLVVKSHHHGSVEIFYVLSGTLGHEVNGEMHMLTPGMVGVVRPQDSVRHVVPKESDVKLLLIWAPGGESKGYFDEAKKAAAKQK